MRRSSGVAILVALLAATPGARAQTAPVPQGHGVRTPTKQDDPPYHHRYAQIEIVIKSGSNLTVEPGPNELHPPRTMACRSINGCEISIAVAIVITQSTQEAYTVCSLVDGSPAKPLCVQHMEFAASTLQHARIAQGTHTVQTQFTDNGKAGVIGSWQANYTLYENGP